VSVDEHTIELAGSPLFFRSAQAAGVPPLYLHDVPMSSDDWLELLAATGGIAPDLIGFGRSGKGGHLDYSLAGLADALEPVIPERISLVAHGWGAAVGLELATRQPERIGSLVLCNPLPLIAGFEWPRPARLWRAPMLGELVMGATNRWLLARTIRRGSVREDSWPPERIEPVWGQFDQGTQRAMLRLHRSTDQHHFESARERIARLDVPALILWGEQDPWLPVGLADAFTNLFPQGRLERVAGAGHWPWRDRPDLVERIAQAATSG
jgi:pimeloyl-ACP methyl ester carboxylesterase